MVDGRSVLKQGQLDILELLYTYRFGSRQLLADSLGMKPDSLYRKLEVLVKHRLVGKRQESRMKLLGVPVAYFLTPKGLRTLAALPRHEHITDVVVKASYHDKTLSQPFVIQTLRVYAQINRIKAFYPNLRAFLRRDMARFSYFPKPFPDAFLSLPSNSADIPPQRFFLDVIPDSLPNKPFFQRIANYAEFFDEDGWKPVSKELPTLLLVGETGTTERRIQRTARAALRSADLDEEITIYTSTIAAVDHLSEEPAIWTSLDDPDELMALPNLLQ